MPSLAREHVTPPAPPPVLLHTGRIAPQRRWRMPLHVHPAHDELIVVVAGELHAHIAGKTLVGTPGEVLRYPAGMPHRESAGGQSPLETLFIACRLPPGTPIPLVSRDRAGHVLHAARWMLSLGADPGGQAVAGRLMEAVVHELASGATGGGEDALVRRVRQYVEYHLAEPLQLADLADEEGMSKYHFARRFATAAGMSPMAFVRQARVRAAQALLATSSLPLGAIAPLVGFPDQTHLSRTFRRVTGRTPGTYRRQEAKPSSS